jgi:hypothetical protein
VQYVYGDKEMTGYYYTRSRATFEIANEQGFENGKYLIGISESYPVNEWRFPKTAHNVALMEHRLGDCVEYPFGDSTRCGKITEIIRLDGDLLLFDGNYKIPKNATIIYRNNKPMPVWDKEGA